jgi:hypothetical protein
MTRSLSLQAEKDERYRSESKKKAIFNDFNFNMGNVGSELVSEQRDVHYVGGDNTIILPYSRVRGRKR